MRVHIVDMHAHRNVLEHVNWGGAIDYAQMPGGIEIRMEIVQDDRDYRSFMSGSSNFSIPLLEDIFNRALENYRRQEEAATLDRIQYTRPWTDNLPAKKEPVVMSTKRSLILERD